MGNAIPSGTLVMKFGGSSVGGTEAFEQVGEIVSQARKEWPRLVVITSAMAGVTNLLLEGATGAIEGNGELIHQIAARIRSQHLAVVEALLPDLARQSQLKQEISHLVGEYTNLCQAITVLGEATPRALDAVASLGERLACVY